MKKLKDQFIELIAILKDIKKSGNDICWETDCDRCTSLGKCGNDIKDKVEEMFKDIEV